MTDWLARVPEDDVAVEGFNNNNNNTILSTSLLSSSVIVAEMNASNLKHFRCKYGLHNVIVNAVTGAILVFGFVSVFVILHR